MDIKQLRSFQIRNTMHQKLSQKGLKNLSEILKEADNILTDIGDLSKEIPLRNPKKAKRNYKSTKD